MLAGGLLVAGSDADLLWLTAVGVVLLLIVIARVAVRAVEGLERIAVRTQESNRSVDSRLEVADRSLARVRSEGIEREKVLETRVVELTSQLKEVVELTSQLKEVTAQIGSNRRAIAQVEKGLVVERSDRILLATRLTDRHLPVRRVLLQMTVHRSGSTRFFDVMRTHPAVRVAPTMEVWRELGLTGRRYPVAFSDTADAGIPLEVEFGVGATVPTIPIAPLPGPTPEDQWCVEKAHPQFADFDSSGLADRIEGLRASGIEVLVAFGIRRPLEAMWSMIDFKARQPSWYVSLGPADIPDWILRSLIGIEEIQKLTGGPIVEYGDFPDGAIFRDLGARLAPAWGNEQVEEWIAFATEHVTPSRRTQRSESGFLGEPNAVRSPDGPDGAWSSLAATMASAEEVYARLLQRQSEAGADPLA